MSGMSLDQFLGHSQNARSSNYMKGWKDNPPHAYTGVLHPMARFLPLWRHTGTKIEVIEDKKTPGVSRREIWSERMVCWEDEETLQKQHWKDKATGERDFPPKVCPDCRMLDWLLREVMAKRLSWLAPVFVYEGQKIEKDVGIVPARKVLRAGGLTAMFGNKNLTAEEKQQMAEVGIYQRDAWQQDARAKLNYVMSVVDLGNPSAGVQIDIQAASLGEKVQQMIRKAVQEYGDEGRPDLHPYAIRFSYNPAEGIPFDQKYDATRMSRVVLSEEVKALLSKSPPDTSRLEERYELAERRAAMERYAVIPMPFDQFFAPALAAKKVPQVAGGIPGSHQPSQGVGAAHGMPLPVASQAVGPTFACHACGKPASEETGVCTVCRMEHLACEQCDKPMLATASSCKSCGKQYKVNATAPAAAVAAPPQQGWGLAPQGQPEDEDIPFITNTLLNADAVASEAWEHGRRSAERVV